MKTVDDFLNELIKTLDGSNDKDKALRDFINKNRKEKVTVQVEKIKENKIDILDIDVKDTKVIVSTKDEIVEFNLNKEFGSIFVISDGYILNSKFISKAKELKDLFSLRKKEINEIDKVESIENHISDIVNKAIFRLLKKFTSINCHTLKLFMEDKIDFEDLTDNKC